MNPEYEVDRFSINDILSSYINYGLPVYPLINGNYLLQ